MKQITGTPNTDTLSSTPLRDTFAVFCVCADPDVAATAAACSSNVQGFFFAGAFGDYITAERRPQFPSAVKAASQCVALIDFDRDPEMALRTAERLNQIFSFQARLIAVGSDLNADLLMRAIRAGCGECLAKPMRSGDFEAALQRFLLHTKANNAGENRRGKILTFFGAKGGVGTTTLAVHLGMHLVETYGAKTLIIDHKHQLGHVALYLGLKSTQYHFDALLRNNDRLDAELLSGYTLKHKSGLHVLASPDYSNEKYQCTQAELESVTEFLRRQYDYVLIDSSVGYESLNFSITDQSDKVFLVSTPDVASLRDLARLVEHMTLSHASAELLHLVINRSTSNESITQEQIRDAVHTDVKLTVPNNFMELLHAINLGEPVAVNSSSPFSLAIANWAAQLATESANELLTADTIEEKQAKPEPRFKLGLGGWKWSKLRYS